MCKACKQPLKSIGVLLDVMDNHTQYDELVAVHECGWCFQKIHFLERIVSMEELQMFFDHQDDGFVSIISVDDIPNTEDFRLRFVFHGVYRPLQAPKTV